MSAFIVPTRHAAQYALPVVDESNRPIGLVSRSSVIEFFIRPCTQELCGRRPVEDFLDRQAITVDRGENIDDITRIIVDAGMRRMLNGFIITDRGRYAGMGNGRDLLHELTERKQTHLYRLAHYDGLTGQSAMRRTTQAPEIPRVAFSPNSGSTITLRRGSPTDDLRSQPLRAT